MADIFFVAVINPWVRLQREGESVCKGETTGGERARERDGEREGGREIETHCPPSGKFRPIILSCGFRRAV